MLRDPLLKTKSKHVVFVGNTHSGEGMLSFCTGLQILQSRENKNQSSSGHMPIMIMIMHIVRIERAQICVLLCHLLSPGPWDKEKTNAIIISEIPSIGLLQVTGRARGASYPLS